MKKPEELPRHWLPCSADMIALVHAALYFDASEYGKREGLSFSAHPVGQSLQKSLPITECGAGSSQTIALA